MRLPQILPDPTAKKFAAGSVWRVKSSQLWVVVRAVPGRVLCAPVQPDGVTRTPMKKPMWIAAESLHYPKPKNKA